MSKVDLSADEKMDRPSYSIVVISRNRPEFLNRLFTYYSKAGLKAPMFLGDASSEVYKNEIRLLVGQYETKLTIFFTEYGEDICPVERLFHEYNKVETRYVVWVGDDDFVVPASLDEAASLMDIRDDCVAVLGEGISFSVYDDKVHGRVSSMGDYLQQQVDHEVIFDRIVAQANIGQAVTYSLRKTSLARQIAAFQFQAMAGWPLSRMLAYFFELSDGLITVASGKILKINRLMMARQVHSGSTNIRLSNDEPIYMLPLSAVFLEAVAKLETNLNAILKNKDVKIQLKQSTTSLHHVIWMMISKAMNKSALADLRGHMSNRPLFLDKWRNLFKDRSPFVVSIMIVLRQMFLLRGKSRKDFLEILRTIQINSTRR